METAMTEFLSRLDGPILIPLTAIAGGLIIGLVSIVAGYWHKNREMEVKQDMLNRGMTAEEIKTVLEASSKK